MLLVARYTGNLSLRNYVRKMLKVKPHFGPLDAGTSASFIIHWAQRTSATSHLPNGKTRFTVACSHNSPDKYKGTGCPVHLLKENNEKHHLLPDFRAARSNAMQFNSVECEILANRLGWLGCHCLQHLVARFPDFNSDCKNA